MIRQLFNANKTLVALLAGNFFLLAVLFAEWQFDTMNRAGFERELQQKHKPADMHAKLPEFEIPLAGQEEYAAIVEHPLFLEGREPVENTEESPQITAAAPQGAEMNMSLSGIAVLPDAVMALLTDKAGKHYRIKKGESVQGWEVESVQDDKVVMVNGTERREILLREFKNQKTSKPGTAPVPPPQAQRPNAPPGADAGRHGGMRGPRGSDRAPLIPIPNPAQAPAAAPAPAPAQAPEQPVEIPPPVEDTGSDTSEYENAESETQDQ